MRFPILPRRAARMLAPSNLSFNFTVTAHLRGPLERTQLEHAFARLCRRHPLLGARVLVEGEKAYLTNDDAQPVHIELVARTSDTTWVAEVERGLLVRPDYANGPLIRCIWVKDDEFSDLVLVIDHGTADGRSAAIALRDLLAFIADPALELETIEPIRMASAVTPKIAQKVAELEAVIPMDGPPPPPWTPQLSDDPRTITPLSLNKDETTALINRCHAEGVTVQAALCAAFLKPFALRNPDQQNRWAEVPLDLRPYLQHPIKDWYGAFMTLALVEVDCSGNSLWDIARRAYTALKALNPDDLFFVAPAVFQIADRVPPVKMFDADYDVSISNLGRLDVPAHAGPVELLGVHAPTFNVTMANHRVLGVATASGKLCATYTSRDPLAPQLADEGWSILRQMLN